MTGSTRIARAVMGRIASPRASRSDGVSGKTPAQLRTLAERARSTGDWAQASFFRRHLCELEPRRAGNWIQLGHALKEVGFYQRSEDAYLKAVAILPDDADLQAQLGHLAKVRGDLHRAADFFMAAAERNHPAKAELIVDANRLRRLARSAVFIEGFQRDDAKAGVKFYLSVPGRQVKEDDKAAIEAGLGRADYSYSFAMQGFINALDALELDYDVLERVELIADIRDRSDAEVNIHLGFYPPDRLRVLKGAYNINCFAWEFDRLRAASELVDHHAFADQATMLSNADELWVPSAHGTEAVRNSTSRPVHHVAAPILSNLRRHPRTSRPSQRDVDRSARALSTIVWQPLSIIPRMQPSMDSAAAARQTSLQSILSQTEGRPSVYLSIFNVHDFRKQILPMLEGFVAFSRDHPDAVLLLKITTPFRGHETVNAQVMKEQIFNGANMIPPMISDRIWMTDAVLTRGELNSLLDLSAFYVCTSYAEGQNLPLLEAMGRGVVPISVDHTAMAEYIAADNAIVIASERRPLDVRLTARYNLYGICTNFVEGPDVSDALTRAEAISEQDYTSMSGAALERIRLGFGLETIAANLTAVVERASISGQTP